MTDPRYSEAKPASRSLRAPSKSKREVERHSRIFGRQPTTATFRPYEPAVLANRAEAPRKARYTRISANNRLGRVLHAGSGPELIALLMALQEPRVIEIREQFAMHPVPTPHPLTGHPRASAGRYPDLPGTIAVASELQAAELIPLVLLDHNGVPTPTPSYLVADVLVILEDVEGLYVVVLCVKDKPEAFSDAFGSRPADRNWTRTLEFRQRIDIEIQYFAAARIPVRLFAAYELPGAYRANLEMLFDWASRRPMNPIPEELIRLLKSVDLQTYSGLELLRHSCARLGITEHDFKVAFYSLIWRLEVAVDLNHKLLFDRPLWLPRKEGHGRVSKLFDRAQS